MQLMLGILIGFALAMAIAAVRRRATRTKDVPKASSWRHDRYDMLYAPCFLNTQCAFNADGVSCGARGRFEMFREVHRVRQGSVACHNPSGLPEHAFCLPAHQRSKQPSEGK